MFGKKTLLTVLVVAAAYGWNVYYGKPVEGIVVETPLGQVKGIQLTSRAGRDYYGFLGLPFALPPVGDLRFASPQPASKWEGIRDASRHGSQCIQLELITGKLAGEEDCLYLNVYVPKSRKGQLPVMLFIHGGGFQFGSANTYGAKYFMDHDVVLITINYRLAAMGFLNTGDDVVRGNMGLKDQTMALRWVQSNIGSFGGDPKQVTIFGESAGGASVQFQTLSPLAKGLFSKAITQSGSAINHWAIWTKPKEQAVRYASKFNCPTENTKEMVACLRKLDARTFVQAHEEVLVALRDQITIFVPTVEVVNDKDAFLVEDPLLILQSGRFEKVPMIAGVNSEEGLLTASIVTANQTKLDQASNDWNYWAPKILNYSPDDNISQKIRKFYFGNAKDIANINELDKYVAMFSDRTFFNALHNFAQIYPKHAPLHLYYYKYKGEFSLAEILAATQGPYLPAIVNIIATKTFNWLKKNVLGSEVPHMGSCHGDEIPLMFNWNVVSPNMDSSHKDYPLSIVLVKAWAEFAINKYDSGALTFNGTLWPTVQTSLKFMEIDDGISKIIDEPFTDRVNFWNSLHLK